MRFGSERGSDGMEAFVVLPETGSLGTNHVIWRWQGLGVPAGSPVEFEAEANSGVLGARNEGGLPVAARLVRERAGESGPESLDYGRITIPAGGVVRLTPFGPSSAPRMREEADADGDGGFERASDRLPNAGPEAPRLLPVRVDWAKKRIRLRVQGAAREEVVVERSGNLRSWESFAVESVADDASAMEGELDTGATFFRLRRK